MMTPRTKRGNAGYVVKGEPTDPAAAEDLAATNIARARAQTIDGSAVRRAAEQRRRALNERLAAELRRAQPRRDPS
jgi:hypothetical protein